jgi:spore germination cell wall hydrolase CwlJ-like protein
VTNIIIIVALTIFGEASGEPLAGKQAVASVIWHRAGGDPAQLVAVCKARRQFSCWNDRTPKVPNDYPSRKAWAECKAIAERMAAGTFEPTIRATHYHADSVTPVWAGKMRLVAIIGGHRFYREA